MIIHLHNTSKIIEVNGVPARIWEGTTDKGVPVTALVTRIAVDRDEDAAEFERDLGGELPPPRIIDAWPARMFID